MLGTVLFFHEDRRWGRIRSEDGESIYVHATEIPPNVHLTTGDRVEFETGVNEKGAYAVGVRIAHADIQATPPLAAPVSLPRNCFIVMPYGRTQDEIRWYAGWYRLVIEEGVRAAGYQPILSAAQHRPDAINDEIRSHLALDPMVVVDLGGVTPEDEPNPNVMYELGIRHAFSLPHVIMGWEGQRLPFDISNQRALLARREMIDVPNIRERLTAFLQEAAVGNYYRPMDAVGRTATLNIAEQRLGPGSVLGALVEEVRGLREGISYSRWQNRNTQLKKAFSSAQRNSLRANFLKAGGTDSQWSKLMNQPLDREVVATVVAAPEKVNLLLELAAKYPPKRKKPKHQALSASEPAVVIHYGEDKSVEIASDGSTTTFEKAQAPSDLTADHVLQTISLLGNAFKSSALNSDEDASSHDVADEVSEATEAPKPPA